MSIAAAEADRRIGNILRIGKVTAIDPGGPRATVDFGDITAPELRVAQFRAGGLSFWWMPEADEQVLVGCPSGDVAQGVIIASIYADNAPSSDPATPMIALGGGKMIVDGDLEVTGSVKAAVEVEAAGVKLTSHKHKGVTPGGGLSKEPVK